MNGAETLRLAHDERAEKGVLPTVELHTPEPWLMTKERFNESAPLFHGSKMPGFSVDMEFEYGEEEIVDDFTLGYGLYATFSSDLAERYRIARGSSRGRLGEMAPLHARHLKLMDFRTADHSNSQVPAEMAKRFWKGTYGLVSELRKSKDILFGMDTLLDTALAMHKDLFERNFKGADLRKDILGSGVNLAWMLGEEWKQLVRELGCDGVIYK